MHDIAIPLSNWADAELSRLAVATGSQAIAALGGSALLGERAALNGFRIPGRLSAGGGCRLLPTRGSWIALNLARVDDRELLPALFGDGDLDPHDDAAIASRVAAATDAELVATGRELGLAIAALREPDPGPAHALMTQGAARPGPVPASPLVVDLSALWAGPLAGHLFGLAGATVLKVESRPRPDAMRDGDPALFARLNQGKASIAVDLRHAADRAALIGLIRGADIVIEAARPRALLQLGIDADDLVRATPGLVWITITGHGATGDAAHWVGFGDDCGVAGGLSAAMLDAGGGLGFVGDAIGDPLTGILAARLGWEQWRSGRGARLALSMRGVAAGALEAERQRDPTMLDAVLRQWAGAAGQHFPALPTRASGPIRPFGGDTRAWIGETAAC